MRARYPSSRMATGVVVVGALIIAIARTGGVRHEGGHADASGDVVPVWTAANEARTSGPGVEVTGGPCAV